MKKLLFLLLLVAGALALLAILKKRSDSEFEDWGSFAGDSYSKATSSVTGAAEAAKGVAKKTTTAAKEAATKATSTAKDVATKAASASKQAAS